MSDPIDPTANSQPLDTELDAPSVAGAGVEPVALAAPDEAAGTLVDEPAAIPDEVLSEDQLLEDGFEDDEEE